MNKDFGSEQFRTLVHQTLLTEDQLANYPSYGWPLRCRVCCCPPNSNKLRIPECDGVTGRCANCGATLTIQRYLRILSVEAKGTVAQMHIQKYNVGVQKGITGDFVGALDLFDQALSFGFDRSSIECRKLALDAINGKVGNEAASILFEAVDALDQGEMEQYERIS